MIRKYTHDSKLLMLLLLMILSSNALVKAYAISLAKLIFQDIYLLTLAK